MPLTAHMAAAEVLNKSQIKSDRWWDVRTRITTLPKNSKIQLPTLSCLPPPPHLPTLDRGGVQVQQLSNETWITIFTSDFPPQLCLNIGVIFSYNTKSLGKPSFQKSAVFLNIVQKAFDPPPLLFEHLSYFAGGVFWTQFWAFDIMYLFHPQISPSMPQKSLFMQISCC